MPPELVPGIRNGSKILVLEGGGGGGARILERGHGYVAGARPSFHFFVNEKDPQRPPGSEPLKHMATGRP